MMHSGSNSAVHREAERPGQSLFIASAKVGT
jgi:hypothetical protein